VPVCVPVPEFEDEDQDEDDQKEQCRIAANSERLDAQRANQTSVLAVYSPNTPRRQSEISPRVA